MRRLSAIALLLACLLLLPTASAAASDHRDAFDNLFSSKLNLLDAFYELDTAYMQFVISGLLYSYEEAELSGWQPKVVDAKLFEETLYRHFAPTDAQLAMLRAECAYDEEAGSYLLQFISGFGGSLPPRRYLGYRQNEDGSFDVFWQNITYLHLDQSDGEIMSALEAAGWPATWEHKGVTYSSTIEGYVATLSYDDHGRKYRVEYDGEVVRLLSCSDYTAADLPDSFDHKEQATVFAPAGVTLIGAEEAFPTHGTVVISVADPTPIRARFPHLQGQWFAYTLKSDNLPKRVTQLSILLPADLPEELFACVTDIKGNPAQVVFALEETENGKLLTLPLSVGNLPTIAFCAIDPFAETEPEDSVPQESTPPSTTAPPDTETLPETVPPGPVVPDTAPSSTPSNSTPETTGDPETLPPPSSTLPGESVPNPPAVTDPIGTDAPEDKKKGCGSVLELPALLLAALFVAIRPAKRKKAR